MSLIAYNFVIDSQLPKLEYLTIMDFIILVSYFYATIPNFITIIRFRMINSHKDYLRYQTIEKFIGLTSYILLILVIISFNLLKNIDHSSGLLLGLLN